MKFRIFSFLILYALLMVLIVKSDSLYSKYVIVTIYGDSSCSEQSYLTTWIFPSDHCHSFSNPFGHIVNYTYNEETNSVEYIIFEDWICLIYSNETIVYKVNECYDVEHFEGSIYYANFTVSSELEVDEEASEKWIVEEYFVDSDCNKPVPEYIHSYSKAAMRHLSYEEIQGEGFVDLEIHEGGFVLSYCTEESFVDLGVGLMSSDHKTLDSWNKLPRSLEGECIQAIDRFYGWMTQYVEFGSYFRRRCMTQTQFEDEYFSLLPTKSSNSFLKMEFLYNEECSGNYYEIHVVPLDICIYSSVRQYADYQTEVRIYYVEKECEGEMWMVGSQHFEDDYLNGRCNVFKNFTVGPENPNVLYDHVSYFKKYLSEDPYFPSQIALLESYLEHECTFEVVIRLKGSPGVDAYLSYFDEKECMSLADYLLGVDEIGYLSFQGKCVDGVLELTLYTQSYYCLGEYEIRIGDICLELDMGVGVATCIPRTCGGISELSKEKVCNGHGTCIVKDKCDCENGYNGNLCQSWTCDGIEKDDSSSVCGGNGECTQVDQCDCSWGFSGIYCEYHLVGIGIISTVSTAVTILTVMICLCFCIGCCVVCPVCVLFSCCFFSIFVGGSGITVDQKRRLSNFQKLEDFDLYLKEQLIEEQEGDVAKIKIDRQLFKIPIEEIKLKKILGRGGSNSVVYLANWSGKKVAFKCFKTSSFMYETSKNDFEDFEKEVKLITGINHPHIIRCYGASLKPPRVGIVMEYCSNGELLEFVVKYRLANKHYYPIGEKIRLCNELISAIKYLHSRNIIHRDIKSGNVLIDSSNNCKLTDFGISRTFEGGSSTSGSSSGSGEMTKRVGTSTYMAPEVVMGGYDQKCDSFSFAILLVVLFSERNDIYGENFRGELYVAQDPTYRPNLEEIFDESFKNSEYYDWIKHVIIKCWDHESSRRYDFETLMEIFDTSRKVKLSTTEKSNDEKVEEDNEKENEMKNERKIQKEDIDELSNMLRLRKENEKLKRVLRMKDIKLEEVVQENERLREENEKLKIE